jgi:putative serine protease PepD
VASGQAASTAGLRAGDTIVALNGSATGDVQALSAVLATLAPGQALPVGFHPSGSTDTSTVTVTRGLLLG